MPSGSSSYLLPSIAQMKTDGSRFLKVHCLLLTLQQLVCLSTEPVSHPNMTFPDTLSPASPGMEEIWTLEDQKNKQNGRRNSWMPSQVVMTPKEAIIKREKARVKTEVCSSPEEKCRRNDSHESIIKNAFIFFSIFINNEEMLRTYCRLILTPQNVSITMHQQFSLPGAIFSP